MLTTWLLKTWSFRPEACVRPLLLFVWMYRVESGIPIVQWIMIRLVGRIHSPWKKALSSTAHRVSYFNLMMRSMYVVVRVIRLNRMWLLKVKSCSEAHTPWPIVKNAFQIWSIKLEVLRIMLTYAVPSWLVSLLQVRRNVWEMWSVWWADSWVRLWWTLWVFVWKILLVLALTWRKH